MQITEFAMQKTRSILESRCIRNGCTRNETMDHVEACETEFVRKVHSLGNFEHARSKALKKQHQLHDELPQKRFEAEQRRMGY